MPTFVDAVKKECELIRFGLDLFVHYDEILSRKGELPAGDVRAAIYAMQLVLDKCHLSKQEDVLYPALQLVSQETAKQSDVRKFLASIQKLHDRVRRDLLEVRRCVDEYEIRRAQAAILAMQIAEFIRDLNSYLEIEMREALGLADTFFNLNQQRKLQSEAQRLVRDHGASDLRGPRLIFAQLRAANGLPAA